MNPKCRFIALVDLLGFSALVSGAGLTTATAVLRRFQAITRSTVSGANKRRVVRGIDRGVKSKLRLFSDLILIYTQGDSHDDCMDIIEVCSKVFRLGFENGLLPRGAIAWGDMIIAPSIVVGKPLVEAHHLESQQEWAGISLCDSMSVWDSDEGLTGDQRASILGIMEERGWLIRWEVPMKSSDRKKWLAINWLTFDNPPYRHTRFADTSEEIDDDRVRTILENTEIFYRHLMEQA